MAFNDKKVSKPKKVARKSRNLNKDSDYKLELANSIAKNSKKVVTTYAHIENSVIYFFRWISGIIDKYNNSLQIKCNAGDIIVLN